MKNLIDKKKLLADLKRIKDVLIGAGDPFLAGVLNWAIDCVEQQPVVAIVPATEAKIGG